LSWALVMSTELIPHSFFVGLRKKNGLIVGHAVRSGGAPVFSEPLPEQDSIDRPVIFPDVAANFKDNLSAYVLAMAYYRKFIAFTLGLAPFASMALAGHKISEFVTARGQQRPDLSQENLDVYELSNNVYREFSLCRDEIESAITAASHLPSPVELATSRRTGSTATHVGDDPQARWQRP
jgi:hypothetical protein